MSDLFPVDETLSPRLAWMRKHGVVVVYDEPDVDDYDGNENHKPWRAYVPDHPDRFQHGYGRYDEDEALEHFGMANNIPLWYME